MFDDDPIIFPAPEGNTTTPPVTTGGDLPAEEGGGTPATTEQGADGFAAQLDINITNEGDISEISTVQNISPGGGDFPSEWIAGSPGAGALMVPPFSLSRIQPAVQSRDVIGFRFTLSAPKTITKIWYPITARPVSVVPRWDWGIWNATGQSKLASSGPTPWPVYPGYQEKWYSATIASTVLDADTPYVVAGVYDDNGALGSNPSTIGFQSGTLDLLGYREAKIAYPALEDKEQQLIGCIQFAITGIGAGGGMGTPATLPNNLLDLVHSTLGNGGISIGTGNVAYVLLQ